MMVYGLPTRFTAVTVGGAFLLFQFLPATIGGPLYKATFPVLFVVVPALVALCFKLGRKDWHIDSLMICINLFWPFRASERWFLCGQPPESHKAKKRRL